MHNNKKPSTGFRQRAFPIHVNSWLNIFSFAGITLAYYFLYFNRLLKNYFHVILNEVKDLFFGWKYEILRCAQNDRLSTAKRFSTICQDLTLLKHLSVKEEKTTLKIALWSGGHTYSSDVSTFLASAAAFRGRTFRYTESGELSLPSTTSRSRSIEMPKCRSFVRRYG